MTDVAKLIATGAVPATAAAVAGLDPAERRAVGTGLAAVVRGSDWWTHGEATALAIAAVGCLPTAAKAAAVLGRRGVWLDAEAGRQAIETAQRHGVGWLADLAYRLAAATNAEQTWPFVSALLAHEKAAPPTSDEFVRGWVVALSLVPRSGPPRSLVDRLWTDPYLDPLLSRLFEVDGIGLQMNFTEVSTGEPSALPAALARLAAERRLDRAALLDRCLGRLLRGDRPAALRPFVVLHDRLAPTPDEVTARAGDYLRLLADAPPAVATMAQKALREVPGLELDAVLDVSGAVLLRPEKTLVKAQLTWLDRLARRNRNRAADIAAVIAMAAEHPAAEVRDRVAKLAPTPSPVAVASGPVGDSLPVPAGPAPAPPPITDPDELVAEVAALGEAFNGGFPGPIALERVLDGLIRLGGTDRDRVGRLLAPVLDRYSLSSSYGGADSTLDLLGAALCAGAGLVPEGSDTAPGHGRLRSLLDRFRGLGPVYGTRLANPGMRAPQRLLWARLAEIAENGRFATRAGLLCAPTSANGSLDPTVLYDRLAALGAGDAWPWDLAQAVLRLPPVVDEALANRAAALRSFGGDRLADWLRAGGLPAQVGRAVTVAPEPQTFWAVSEPPDPRVLVETAAPAGYDDGFRLLTIRADATPAYGWTALWPAALPGYRELVATYVLPDVAAAAIDGMRGGGAALPALAEATGTGGVALAVAMAYGLAARHEPDRVAALDALLLLAGAGELDAHAVGTHIGGLSRHGILTAGRVVGPLRDAHAAGAPLTTWRILAAALPELLVMPKPPPGTPDLLTLAAETAAATGCRVEVPGLAGTAARGGSSRLVTEARRLAAALA